MDHLLIENEKSSIKIYPQINYLEYQIKPGATIDVGDVIRSKKEVTRLCPNHKFFVLAESRDFFNLTREARRTTSTKEYADNTHCIAFFTSNFSVAMLGELYSKINKPAVPTKMFTNREKAKAWLWKQMEASQPDNEAAE